MHRTSLPKGPVTIMAAFMLALTTAALAQNVRLTNDFPGGGYVSAYTLATGTPYTDAVLNECSIARGRQNEPAVAVDPRDIRVLIGSSNDYCGVYSGGTPAAPQPTGPIWLGYYRSENSGAAFQSSLVPGYPGDASPFAALAQVRTSGSGDPVVAWDGHGRVYLGSESSGDPALSKKTFGDVWVAMYDNPGGETGTTINDGNRFRHSVIVQRGSSAPNLLGNFQDKTALNVDHTGGPCDGTVYFAWVRFSGGGGEALFLSRSTDHGETWSPPTKLTESVQLFQNPDISITGNGHVYVTYSSWVEKAHLFNGVAYTKSTDCGGSFTRPVFLQTFTRYRPLDISDPQPIPIPAQYRDDPYETEESAADAIAAGATRECGDFDSHCLSGYTFFRLGAIGSQVRSSADQFDAAHEYVYIVYEASKPDTIAPTGTTYGSVGLGIGSQSGVYFTRLTGTTGANTAPVLIDDQSVGHQIFPAISADGGVLHAVWWDSRLDAFYSPLRPIGNDAAGHTGPALDAWSATSADLGATWTRTRLSTVTSNPNYEQFSNRTVPFAGDYLWITSLGNFSFATWTDWRNTVQGTDPREGTGDEDGSTADVLQCRTFDTTLNAWTGDTCPHAGGLDQDIYGSITP
jgi:hypothetical protein